MKCPKCGFVSYSYLDACKRCGTDLREYKRKMGIVSDTSISKSPLRGRPAPPAEPPEKVPTRKRPRWSFRRFKDEKPLEEQFPVQEERPEKTFEEKKSPDESPEALADRMALLKKEAFESARREAEESIRAEALKIRREAEEEAARLREDARQAAEEEAAKIRREAQERAAREAAREEARRLRQEARDRAEKEALEKDRLYRQALEAAQQKAREEVEELRREAREQALQEAREEARQLRREAEEEAREHAAKLAREAESEPAGEAPELKTKNLPQAEDYLSLLAEKAPPPEAVETEAEAVREGQFDFPPEDQIDDVLDSVAEVEREEEEADREAVEELAGEAVEAVLEEEIEEIIEEHVVPEDRVPRTAGVVAKGGVAVRALGTIFDLIRLLVILVIFLLLGSGVLTVDGASPGLTGYLRISGPIYLLFLILAGGYFTFFIGSSGQTPGMTVFGLKVVNKNGEVIGYSLAFLRHVTSLFSFLLFGMGIWWIPLDLNKQAWHDKLTQSVVIRV